MSVIEFPNTPLGQIQSWSNAILRFAMAAGNDPELALPQEPRACAIGALQAAACLLIGAGYELDQRDHLNLTLDDLFRLFLRHFDAGGKVDDKQWAFEELRR